MLCIYPNCDEAAPDTEAGKRQIIDHINHDHDDAHVLIACAHEWEERERYSIKAPGGEDVEQIKSECVRCGQFMVEDAPEDIEGAPV